MKTSTLKISVTVADYLVCMPSPNDKVHSKDSTSNLLRLFNGTRADHRVVTRSDLTTDYSSSDDSPRTSNSDGVVTINNYYTWNSPKTNSSIRKERAEIVSALHKSSSDLHRGLTTCNSFTRSHNMRKIMSMCADCRSDFSTDEYHRHDQGNSGNERMAVETEPDDVATTVWSTSGEAADRRRCLSSHIGGASRCWSCTATDRETDDDDVDEENNNVTTDESQYYRRMSENHRLSRTKKLTRKIRYSRDSG